jgi:hypothetical protein
MHITDDVYDGYELLYIKKFDTSYLAIVMTIGCWHPPFSVTGYAQHMPGVCYCSKLQVLH